ncbi:unnamed protein product [Pleuronectes platessa]|uniref:Uncharacterized protein n=1 Tax=Pleuronectes platessa TaxID=8262 RepID=A0A9N7VRX2_PLEPL|nr:unnamed protein product [Pleuronectes platessa]
MFSRQAVPLELCTLECSGSQGGGAGSHSSQQRPVHHRAHDVLAASSDLRSLGAQAVTLGVGDEPHSRTPSLTFQPLWLSAESSSSTASQLTGTFSCRCHAVCGGAASVTGRRREETGGEGRRREETGGDGRCEKTEDT